MHYPFGGGGDRIPIFKHSLLLLTSYGYANKLDNDHGDVQLCDYRYRRFRRRRARIGAFPRIDLAEKVICVSMIDDRAWCNATFSSFPRSPGERPVFPTIARGLSEIFRQHRSQTRACQVYRVEARGGSCALNNNAHFLGGSFQECNKIVRVSHNIIICDTKNGINIIRTGAVIP